MIQGLQVINRKLRKARPQPAAGEAVRALRVAYRHLDMGSMRVSHCKDAAIIEAALSAAPTLRPFVGARCPECNAEFVASAEVAPAPVVPEGTEPTPEMLARFVSVYSGTVLVKLTKRQLSRARRAYAAMLDAPQAEGNGHVG